jgi:hypothetical protein
LGLLSGILGGGSGCLKEVGYGDVVLLVLPKKSVDSGTLGALKCMLGKTPYGIYFTVNKPYNSLMDSFSRNRVNAKNLFLIDAITERVAGGKCESEKCVFLNSVYNLGDVSLAVSSVAERRPSKDSFFFFDSLSTLRLYNDVDAVGKFVFFLSGRLKQLGMASIFCVEDGPGVQEFSRYCDKVIEFK